MLLIGEVHGDRKQGAGYGYTKKLGYHPIVAVRSDTGDVLTSATARAKRTRSAVSRGSLTSCSRGCAASGIPARSSSAPIPGFENHKLMKILHARGSVLDRRQDQPDDQEADRRDSRDRLGERRRLPRDRRGADRRDRPARLQTDRPPHPPHRGPGRAVPRLAPLRIRDQPQHPDAHRRSRSSRPRHDRARDPRPQRPSTGALPQRADARQQRLDRDRRLGAQPRTLENPHRAAQPARPDRPHPPPRTPTHPRPPDPHQPKLDPPNARR